jgi:hypothetical protein
LLVGVGLLLLEGLQYADHCQRAPLPGPIHCLRA